MNRRTALKRAGALAVALGALEAVGPFSFTPVRVGASIVPSDIPFDISAFLPVPPQNFGTDVQFQLLPVHTVSSPPPAGELRHPPRLRLTELARPKPHHGLRPAARRAVADLRPPLRAAPGCRCDQASIRHAPDLLDQSGVSAQRAGFRAAGQLVTDPCALD
jgi:hypothetical protein